MAKKSICFEMDGKKADDLRAFVNSSLKGNIITLNKEHITGIKQLCFSNEDFEKITFLLYEKKSIATEDANRFDWWYEIVGSARGAHLEGITIEEYMRRKDGY